MDGDLADRLRAAVASSGVRLLCLHGSRATGRARADSDLDLAAWYGDAARAGREEAALFEAILAAVPPGTPPVALAILDLADPLLQFLVATDGQPIYEADASAFVEFSVRAASAYHDTAPRRAALRAWLRAYARAATAAGKGEGAQ